MRIFSPLLLTCAFAGICHAQTSGGPDKFGYKWANDQDSIGSAPVYNWIDIKDTANLITGLGDDNASQPQDLGFYFNYYGKWYNQLWIGSNGWISFQNAGNIAAPFPVIPSGAAPHNYIAGMLADLTFVTPGSVKIPGAAAYFRTNHTDSVIVQYDSVPFWMATPTGYSGSCTFQIILSGADHSIKFQYKEIYNESPGYDMNSGLRIGIEDSTGLDGLMVLDTFPSDSSVIKFFYPGYFSTNDLESVILSLGQNSPNPAGNATSFNYLLRKASDVKISVHNILGAEIYSFASGRQQPGNHTFTLSTQAYPAGIYFYSLQAGKATSTRKMVIAR